MLDLEQIVKKMQDRNLSKIGRELNISAVYMHLLKKGTAKNPTYKVHKALSDYFERNQ